MAKDRFDIKEKEGVSFMTDAIVIVDKELDQTLEEVISKKLSHIGTYQIFDTTSGKYTTVKWAPNNKDGENIGVDIDSLMKNAGEGIKRFLKELEEDLEKTKNIVTDTLETV